MNVFFGINGSGKTTLLKIFHSALSLDTSFLVGLPFKKAEVEIYLNRHEAIFKRLLVQREAAVEKVETQAPSLGGETYLTNLHTLLGTSKTGGLEWRSEPPEPDDDGTLTPYSEGYLPITRLYRSVGTQTSGTKVISEGELDARFAAEVQRRWKDYQSEVSRRVSEVQGEGLAKILHLILSGEDEITQTDSSVEIRNAYERVATFLSRQQGFGEVLDSRDEFENKYRTRPQTKSVVKQIDLVEQQIEKINAPQERFQRLLESMYSGAKRIVFGEKEITVEVADKTKIRLPSLSSGEKQLFLIALEAIRAGNHSLIIDEPELSMHVDWQKRLIPSLRQLNPRTQLIIATHSPEIMADLPEEKTFSL